MEKNEAKQFYLKLGHVWCPVLNDYIAFNNIGFRHLLRHGRRPRLRSDQHRRLLLLPLATDIVADPQAELVLGKNDLPDKKFFALRKKKGGRIITVVIRQVGNGSKHFFSIYD